MLPIAFNSIGISTITLYLMRVSPANEPYIIGWSSGISGQFRMCGLMMLVSAPVSTRKVNMLSSIVKFPMGRVLPEAVRYLGVGLRCLFQCARSGYIVEEWVVDVRILVIRVCVLVFTVVVSVIFGVMVVPLLVCWCLCGVMLSTAIAIGP